MFKFWKIGIKFQHKEEVQMEWTYERSDVPLSAIEQVIREREWVSKEKMEKSVIESITFTEIKDLQELALVMFENGFPI